MFLYEWAVWLHVYHEYGDAMNSLEWIYIRMTQCLCDAVRVRQVSGSHLSEGSQNSPPTWPLHGLSIPSSYGFIDGRHAKMWPGIKTLWRRHVKCASQSTPTRCDNRPCIIPCCHCLTDNSSISGWLYLAGGPWVDFVPGILASWHPYQWTWFLITRCPACQWVQPYR